MVVLVGVVVVVVEDVVVVVEHPQPGAQGNVVTHASHTTSQTL